MMVNTRGQHVARGRASSLSLLPQIRVNDDNDGIHSSDGAITSSNNSSIINDEDNDVAVYQWTRRRMSLVPERRIFCYQTPSYKRYVSACERFQCDQDSSVAILLNTERSHCLHLSDRFGPEGMLALGEVLRFGTSITSLDFRGCRPIGSAGCYVLQAVLESSNCAITYMDLSHMHIGHNGGIALGKALEFNRSLTSLVVRGNYIGMPGAIAIADSLKINTTLRYLNLENCAMGFHAADTIHNALRLRKMDQITCCQTNGNHVMEEVLNSVSHGVGILLSWIGGYAMVKQAQRIGDFSYLVSVWIFTLSLSGMFTASTLAHSFFMKPRINTWLFRFDHCSIYLLIAGTYSPFTLVSLSHTTLGIVFFVFLWLCAIGGIFLSFYGDYVRTRIALTLSMGWSMVLGFSPIVECLCTEGLFFLALGGVLYTLGVYFYIKGMWHPISHAIWHCFVLAAAACHFITIYRHVRPCNTTQQEWLAMSKWIDDELDIDLHRISAILAALRNKI